jgi:hypothetical protein
MYPPLGDSSITERAMDGFQQAAVVKAIDRD